MGSTIPAVVVVPKVVATSLPGNFWLKYFVIILTT
jgi:hypothetical protein